jgi:hypothetical protein
VRQPRPAPHLLVAHALGRHAADRDGRQCVDLVVAEVARDDARLQLGLWRAVVVVARWQRWWWWWWWWEAA